VSAAACKRWLAADAPALEQVELPGGRAVLVLQRSPTRTGEEPCEDAAAVWSSPTATALVVADGVGGAPRGHVAAGRVVQAVSAAWSEAAPDGGALRAATMAAIEDTNQGLLQDGGGSATTVLCAIVAGGELRTCHAGDSELLVVGQRGRVKHRTVSHSPVGYAVESGMLDAGAGLRHEDRHLLSNCVGMAGMRVEVASAIRLAPFDTVVLASDGLWDNLTVDEVVEVVRKGPLLAAAERLLALASQRMAQADRRVVGKPDDLSALLFRQR
jgi:serine/threonine protein phosphatase PrpC